jgi:ATP-dependent DNA ligase
LIVKSANGLWRDKRSNDWLKIKAQETLDLTIIGGFEGQGELDGTLGGVIVDFEGEKVRVGSGFSRSDRDRLYADFQRDLKELEEGGTDFVLFGVTAEVQFQEVTPAGSLRHPVFIRLRKDKDEAKF